MIALGIDPGIRAIGFSVVRHTPAGPVLLDFGMWSPQSSYKGMNTQVIDKIRQLYPLVVELIAKHGVTHIVCELVPVKMMAHRDKVVAVENMLRCIAIQYGLPYKEKAAVSIKKLATGKANASKQMMIDQVFIDYPDMPNIAKLPTDTYDAIMIGTIAGKLDDWWLPVVMDRKGAI